MEGLSKLAGIFFFGWKKTKQKPYQPYKEKKEKSMTAERYFREVNPPIKASPD